MTGLASVAGSAGLVLMAVLWLSRWPEILIAVVVTALVGVVGWTSWVGHLDSEDERLLMILSKEPGMPSEHFRASSGLGPEEYARAVHRLKDGSWIEWGWGAYHLTPRAKAHLEAKQRRSARLGFSSRFPQA
jgi:hypothetical protein